MARSSTVIPFKTPSELGVKDTFEAYYITKLAGWSIVHENYSNPDDFEANGSENETVYQAYLKLLGKAKATTSTTIPVLTTEQTGYNETDDQQITDYIVKSDGVDYTGGYEVSTVGEVPTGTKIEKNGSAFNTNPDFNALYLQSERKRALWRFASFGTVLFNLG